MSLIHSPKIVTDGLVFYYDMNNFHKSWKGAPTNNISDFPATGYNWINSGDGTFTNDDTAEFLPSIPNISPSTLKVVSCITTTSSTTGLHCGYAFTSISPSTTYTMSLWYKKNRDDMSSYGPYLRQSVNNNWHGTFDYNGETNNALWPTNRWIRIKSTFTTSSNETHVYLSNYIGQFVGDKVSYTGGQLELGSIMTPLVNVSRTNNQAVVDITGLNIITAQSLTYNSDGTFSFDGSNNYLQTTTNCNITGDVTLSAWIKPSRVGQTGPHSTIICTDINYPYGAKLMNYKNNERYGIWLGWAGAGNTNYEAFVGANINDNTIKMLTASYNQSSGIAKIYLNGILQSTQNTGITSPVALFDGKITLGTDYNSIGSSNLNKYLGYIYSASVHNRTLTDLEVLQMFNAQRGIYGL